MAGIDKNIWQRELTLSKPFSDKAKEDFYKEFNSLLRSGIDIQRTITILIEEQSNKRVQKILSEVREMLIGGSSLSEALERSGQFTPYEYQSIKIGEETGRMQHVMEHLAEFFMSKVKLKRQMVSVFTYPAFVMLITIGVLYFMLSNVVPMFEDVFKQFGQELPYLTKQIIYVSKRFTTWLIWFFLVIILIGVYGFVNRREPWLRSATSNALMRVPVFGQLVKKIYLARTCQSLALLLSSRTPLVNAITLVGNMIGFYPVEVALKSIKNEITLGGSLHNGLAMHSIFDKRMISLTKIAEETNQLDTTFQRLSEQYQEDIEYRTKLIGTIIEPLIIVVIGLVVGVIMVSMYLPMFNLSNVIK